MASASPDNSLPSSGTPLLPPCLARKKRRSSTPFACPVRSLRAPRELRLTGKSLASAPVSVALIATIITSFAPLRRLRASATTPRGIVLVERAPLQQTCLSLADHLLFTVLGDQKTARIGFRAGCFDQPHPVSPHDLIGCFRRVLHPVDFLYAEHGVRPRSPLHVLHRTDLKIRNHVAVLDLSDRILIAKFVHGVYAEVCGHQVQGRRQVSVDRLRRIGKIETEKLAHDRSAFQICRRDSRQRSRRRVVERYTGPCQVPRASSTSNRSVPVLVNTDYGRRLDANVDGEAERGH